MELQSEVSKINYLTVSEDPIHVAFSEGLTERQHGGTYSDRLAAYKGQWGGILSDFNSSGPSCGQMGGMFSETSSIAPSCGQWGGQFSETSSVVPSCGQWGGEGDNEHEEELYKIFAKAKEYRESMMHGGEEKKTRNPLLMVAIGLAKKIQKMKEYENMKIKWTQLVKIANQLIRESKKLLDISDGTKVTEKDIANIEEKANELIKDEKLMRSLVKVDKELKKHEDDEETASRIMGYELRGGVYY